ncbi:MAG: DegT/DnrJ/EryC1/StrS family aminotransferase [Dethiobacteria bacterium]|jgi:pyridoxal phosphate-dependent aminotransferase EpsN
MLIPKTRIYLSSPHMSGREQKYIQEAFESNWIAPLGQHVDAFEKEIAVYAGVKGAVALSSGTAALHLALRLVGVGPGDVVFCSSLTFVSSANVVLYQGGTPVFIDSEPSTWNMSPAALKRAFFDALKTGRLPKAVMVVNLYGQSADMEPILEICGEFDVPVIEDAAESLGATYRGRKSGSLGKYGIYSFNGNKIITTSGGGMLLGDDLEGLEKARFWATQAREPVRHYEHKEVGYNYRLSNVLAGIGRGQLEVLEERVEARRAVFSRYFTALSGVEGIDFMPEADFGRSSRWLTAMTVDPEKCGVTKDEIIDALEKENIEARPVWKPMHLQPLFRGYKYYTHEDERSVSDGLFDQGICLPSGSNLAEDDQDRVIKCIRRCLNE